MALAICQNCGSILKSSPKNCHSCKSLVSTFSATSLSNLNHATTALSVEMAPDQTVLERALLSQPNYLANIPPALSHGALSQTPLSENGKTNGGKQSRAANTFTLKKDSIPTGPDTVNLAHGWFDASEVEQSPQIQVQVAAPPSANKVEVESLATSAETTANESAMASIENSAYIFRASQSTPIAVSSPENSPVPEQKPIASFFADEPAPETVPNSAVTATMPATVAPKPSLDFFSAAPPLVSPPANEAAPSEKQSAGVSLASTSQSAIALSPQSTGSFTLAEGSVEPPAASSPLGDKKEGEEVRAATELHEHKNDITSDSSDTDEDEAEYIPPPRRSFSGNPETKASKPNLKQNSADDEDDEESRDEAPAKKRSETGEIELFGITLTRTKVVSIAVVACLFLFLSYQVFATVSGTLFSNLGDRLGGPTMKITGVWRFASQVNKTVCRGFMLIHQRGNQIFGTGKDNIGGTFRFAGTLQGGGEMEFLKQYARSGQDVGKPLSFHGTLDPMSNPPFARGDFQTSFRQGYSWRAQIVNVTGPWEAELVRPMAEDAAGSYQNSGSVIKRPGSGDTGVIAQKALSVAIGLVIAAIVIWIAGIRIFGPDGWRAQRNKAKYIPSQFGREHNKELKRLSQPAKPGSLPLGQRVEWKFWTLWQKKILALPPEDRASNPHVLLLGGSGKGKTRLMARMITDDIEAGDRALIIVDSDGSLSELVTRWISANERGKEIAKRVMIIDPTHRGGSYTYNPLKLPEDGDLPNAAAAIEYGFKAIYTEPPGSQSQWSQQTAQILRSAALLLMITNRSLADLPNVLQDNDFRDARLEEAEKKRKEKPEYGPLLDSWSNYKKMARTEQWINWVEPILNRVQRTLSDPRVRPVLISGTADIDLKEVITNKKILIVNIPKGELHENGNLLGSLIVTGLKQAALSLAVKSHALDRPVSLYLDEFDHFIEKETFNALTSETKVFQIGFLGATKTLQDFPEDFRNQLVIKFGTIAVFALAKKDGDMLGPQMFRVDGRKRKHETLTNFINPINTSPQFEFVSDEEKLNIDKVLGQPERVFFCYRVGSVAGLFHMKSHLFNDVADKDVKAKLLEKMRTGGQIKSTNGSSTSGSNGVKPDQVDSKRV